MYFATYIYNDFEGVGILNNTKTEIIPIESFKNIFKKAIPTNMNELIDVYGDNIAKNIKSEIRNIMDKGIPLGNVRLKAPIPFPKRQVFCLGKNYADHAKEISNTKISDSGTPEAPIYFYKLASPAIGDGEVIMRHENLTSQIDYEVELAIIIGKDGSNIEIDKAEDYIFGYTIANDVSARDLQSNRKQWFMGKSLDTFCPMGPFIAEKSEIPFPVELKISCSVNGETRQSSNTKQLIFDIPYIISDISKGISLKKGDIILTGTPAGVGLGHNPPKYLKSSDCIQCSIEKIGVLTNTIQ